jgi:hypothetical protein
VKAQEFAAPASVGGTGATGSLEVPVKFGYAGSYSAVAAGTVAATEQPGVVVQGPTDLDAAIAAKQVSLATVTIPAGTTLTRIALRNADVNPKADLDLYVLDSKGNQVGESAGGSAHETVDLVRPLAGTYFVIIHGFDTKGPTSPYVLYDWSVGATVTGGALSIGAAPAAATVATSGIVTVNWTGADIAHEQIGAVLHNGPTGEMAVTLVELNAKD